MRALVQRVKEASVTIDGQVVGQIGNGMLILLGVKNGDTQAEADFLADKCLGLRIFSDDDGKMNLSAEDIGGEFLVVSQFTLYGNAMKGKRPSYIDAARPEVSEPLYEYFVARLRAAGKKVETGQFGADMQVALVNDGPVTLMIEKERA